MPKSDRWCQPCVFLREENCKHLLRKYGLLGSFSAGWVDCLSCTLIATVQKADLLQVGVECDPNWSNLKSLRITPLARLSLGWSVFVEEWHKCSAEVSGFTA